MKLPNFTPYEGQHCETTTAGCLLSQLDIKLSEPMLFGLGEGLGYLFWKIKSMDFPFIGGRLKPDVLTENLCRNLQLKLNVNETGSIKKAWRNVTDSISAGKAIGLKMDCYHLEYFTNKIHFAGHYACLYGYDDEVAYLVDTKQQGGQVTTQLKNLELARSEKGPMSSKNKSFTIEKTSAPLNLKQAIKTAIINNAELHLNPPITNFGYKGIKKTAKEIKKWFATSRDIKTEFQTSAMLMERAGTGGALFRNLYRDFLKESAVILDSEILQEAHLSFTEIAVSWTKTSELFHKLGETKEERLLDEAAELFLELSFKEKQAMTNLLQLK